MRILAYTDEGQCLAQWHLTESGVSIHPSATVAFPHLDTLAGVLSASGWSCRPPIKPIPITLPEKKEAAVISRDS